MGLGDARSQVVKDGSCHHKEGFKDGSCHHKEGFMSTKPHRRLSLVQFGNCEWKLAFCCSILFTFLHLTSQQTTNSNSPPPPPKPANFSGQQVIIFGTSLSDDGNGEAPYIKGTLNTSKVYPPPPYHKGRWSNGEVWAYYLGYLAQVQVLSYAIGGSAIDPYPWSILANSFTTVCDDFPILRAAPAGSNPHTIPVPTLFDQVNQYIVGGVYPGPKFLNSTLQRADQRIPGNNVYIIEFGGNDLLQFLKKTYKTWYLSDGSPQAVINALQNGTIVNFVPYLVDGVERAMDRLYQAGARYFVLWLMLPATLTPQAISFSNNQYYGLGAAAVTLIEDMVDKGYEKIRMEFPKRHEDAVVATFDVARGIRQVLDNRREYKFYDSETACFNSTNYCFPDKINTPCSPQSQWMWWDNVHPTTHLHEAIAQKMFPGVYDMLVKAKGA